MHGETLKCRNALLFCFCSTFNKFWVDIWNSLFVNFL